MKTLKRILICIVVLLSATIYSKAANVEVLYTGASNSSVEIRISSGGKSTTVRLGSWQRYQFQGGDSKDFEITVVKAEGAYMFKWTNLLGIDQIYTCYPYPEQGNVSIHQNPIYLVGKTNSSAFLILEN